MSTSGFTPWLAFAWRPENDGQPYHRTAGDAGGYTAWAVTYHTYAAWEAAHGRRWPMLTAFAAATQAELAGILHAWTWAACGAALLPAGIDLVVADAACLSGPGTAARLLQSILGVTVDGQVGPKTAAAAAALDPGELAGQFADAYRAHDDALAAAARFEGGWNRRIADALATARAMPGILVA